jgi:hypothetical protein
VPQNLPANLHLELPDQDLVECFKSFKGDPLKCLRLIEVLTLPHEDILQCCYMVSLELLLEYLCLKVNDVLIAQEPIVVSVQDPKYAQQGLFKIRLELLAHRVLQGCYRKQDCFLSTRNNVY